jgi:hypothetical protein
MQNHQANKEREFLAKEKKSSGYLRGEKFASFQQHTGALKYQTAGLWPLTLGIDTQGIQAK